LWAVPERKATVFRELEIALMVASLWNNGDADVVPVVRRRRVQP
jgi:hypothetical protein